MSKTKKIFYKFLLCFIGGVILVFVFGILAAIFDVDMKLLGTVILGVLIVKMSFLIDTISDEVIEEAEKNETERPEELYKKVL